MLRATLDQFAVMDAGSEEPIDSEEEEYMRMQYLAALRRAEEQHLQESGGDSMMFNPYSRQGHFRTPEQPDYFHYYVYGTEKDTASAYYRPQNSSTALRKKPPTGKSKDQSKGQSSQQMNPDQDSFKISAIYSNSQKPKTQNQETTNGKSSGLSLSGSDERDFNYLGSEDAEE